MFHPGMWLMWSPGNRVPRPSRAFQPPWLDSPESLHSLHARAKIFQLCWSQIFSLWCVSWTYQCEGVRAHPATGILVPHSASLAKKGVHPSICLSLYLLEIISSSSGSVCQARHGNTAKAQDISISPPDLSGPFKPCFIFFSYDIPVRYMMSLVPQRRTSIAGEQPGQLRGRENQQLPCRWQYCHSLSTRLRGIKAADGKVWIKQH